MANKKANKLFSLLEQIPNILPSHFSRKAEISRFTDGPHFCIIFLLRANPSK